MRVVTNEDVMKYERLVNMYLKKMAIKNWNEASMSKSKQDIILGNTGMTMEDLRQDLYAEVVVALQKYDPNYRTKEGRSVKEMTFVYQHLFNRLGCKLKRLTKKRMAYGMWASSFENIMAGYSEDMGN